MDKRPLGRSGLHAAPLALGGNVFGWTADEPTSFAILDRFVDSGFSLIDTANSSTGARAPGRVRTIIGKWFKKSGKRDRVLVATKVGMPMQGEEGLKRAQVEAGSTRR
jgi:aryl-alcohol dehydrogenase-like predicted oxidoreductase